MISSKRIIYSYQNFKIAESMTKQEAQKIVDGMPKDRLNKIKGLLERFKGLFTKKEASFFDIVKKINKATGLPLVEITAVGMLFFGGLTPSFADTSKEVTKMEQVVEKRPLSEVKAEIEKQFKLPQGLVKLVKGSPQFAVNLKGIKGFVRTVNRNIKKSLTPEISELLSQIPDDQWPELLSGVVMQKIKADPGVSEKYNAFVKHHKTTDAVMVEEIAEVVLAERTEIKNHIKSVALKRNAFERGYLIS